MGTGDFRKSPVPVHTTDYDLYIFFHSFRHLPFPGSFSVNCSRIHKCDHIFFRSADRRCTAGAQIISTGIICSICNTLTDIFCNFIRGAIAQHIDRNHISADRDPVSESLFEFLQAFTIVHPETADSGIHHFRPAVMRRTTDMNTSGTLKLGSDRVNLIPSLRFRS